MKRIAVIPGDGIGVDVTREALRVLHRVNAVFGCGLEFVEFDWGAEKYLRKASRSRRRHRPSPERLRCHPVRCGR